MNSTLRLICLAVVFVCFVSIAPAQITLSGISYTESFNSLSSGLPSGWTVSTSATVSTLGTAGTFASTATAWNSATAGTDFRNISSDDLTFGVGSPTQNSNSSNRALGWRPLADSVGAREGSSMLTLAHTTGLTGFSLSVTVFAANDVAGSQNYSLEYRVGNTGNFTLITTYTTPSSGSTGFNELTLTANSITLSALNNQSTNVYVRVRGTTTSGTTLDTLGIDNFSLSYSAIPEPSTYAAIFGAGALAAAAWHRRRQRAAR